VSARAPLPAEAPRIPRGLPEHLPAGENMLWQGAPEFRQLAVTAFHIRKVLVYFAILLTWRICTGLGEGAGLAETLRGSVPLATLGAVCLAVIALIAWLSAVTTVYTVTDRRLVVRCGIALPMTVNIPFGAILSADLRRGRGRSGDIAFTLPAGKRIAYLQLWPHVRPWHLKHPKPMLRGLADAESVAFLLAPAMAAATGGSVAARRAVAADAPAAVPVVSTGFGIAAE
jgi:hypothetical protein